MYNLTSEVRALRTLIKRLPLLPTTSKQAIDYPAADARLLVTIRDDAEATIQVFQQGVTAIGQLLVQMAPRFEDGTISADAVGARGAFPLDRCQLELICVDPGELTSIIMGQTGHKSLEMVMRYIRPVQKRQIQSLL